MSKRLRAWRRIRCAVALACIVPLATMLAVRKYTRVVVTRNQIDGRLDQQFRSVLRGLEHKYDARLLKKHTVIGPGLQHVIVPLLLRAGKTGAAPLVFGVTGGSSTAFNDAWPSRLRSFFENRVGLENVQLRNAAMGSTSQLMTAPCIQTLVGDAVDILFWEFAMNDEAPIFNMASNEWHWRHRVAETYIRQAIATHPIVMGFVHFWDLRVHIYPQHDTALPDRSFKPTSTVMRYYDSIYNRYFAVNVIGLMADAKLYGTKSDFLVDGHHPKALAYNVAVDMISYCLLKSYVAAIDGGTESNDLLTPKPNPASSLWDFPLMSIPGNQSPFALPGQRLMGHCLMAAKPTFGNSAIAIARNVSLKNVGKSDVNRADRDIRFVIGSCASSEKLTVQMAIPNIAYIIISCGEDRSQECRHNLQVSLDSDAISHNVDVSKDIMEQFYGWVHRVNQTASRPVTPRQISFCARNSNIEISRIVAMEEIES